MQLSVDRNLIKQNGIQDFMSDEERTYYSNKLLEAEQYNMEHPEVMTSEEFHKKIKEKYGIIK